MTEGDEAGSKTLLNKIYTELYITEGLSEDVNRHHEVWQLEMKKTNKILHERPIKCSQIFEASPEQQGQWITATVLESIINSEERGL